MRGVALWEVVKYSGRRCKGPGGRAVDGHQGIIIDTLNTLVLCWCNMRGVALCEVVKYSGRRCKGPGGRAVDGHQGIIIDTLNTLVLETPNNYRDGKQY